MSPDTATLPRLPLGLDYSLTGRNAALAVEKGLTEAEWYQCTVPRETMRRLLERRNGPAIRDTLIWFGLILAFGFATWFLWGSWWALLPYVAYCVLYGTPSDSRWHEAGHGTAFKTDWMNNALYEIASFMVLRESTVWRWSHTRHHSDTIIVGRDPEIVAPRPPDIAGLLFGFTNVPVYLKYFRHTVLHSLGQMTEDEKTYIPETEFSRVYWKARLCLAIYASVAALSALTGSILPILFIGLPNLFGSWLMNIYGLTQHAGLAENVLDHRLNCRTVHMNAINRFLYWNMNYHLEHHMFPLVPYHALPKLHLLIRDDCPKSYSGLLAAWREIIPALLRQTKNPAYFVERKLPDRQPRQIRETPPPPQAERQEIDGWVEVGPAGDLDSGHVIRFDHDKKTFALARDAGGKLFAIDGICSHARAHLADGFVKDNTLECPKHNGRFHLADGSPARAPICRGLNTYPLEERHGRLHLRLAPIQRDLPVLH